MNGRNRFGPFYSHRSREDVLSCNQDQTEETRSARENWIRRWNSKASFHWENRLSKVYDSWMEYVHEDDADRALIVLDEINDVRGGIAGWDLPKMLNGVSESEFKVWAREIAQPIVDAVIEKMGE